MSETTATTIRSQFEHQWNNLIDSEQHGAFESHLPFKPHVISAFREMLKEGGSRYGDTFFRIDELFKDYRKKPSEEEIFIAAVRGL